MQSYRISFLSFSIQPVLTKLQAKLCHMVLEMSTFWTEFKQSLPDELPFIFLGISSRLDFSLALFSCGFHLWLGSFSSLEIYMSCYVWASVVLFPSLNRCCLLLE